MNQKMSRNTVECQLLYRLGEHYCIVQLSLLTPDSIYCDTCFFADFALTCVYRGERCILNVAYFKIFMCSMARDIVWPFCMFLYKRELSYLTENRYMEVDSLPVEPACFSFFFFLKLYLPLFKKEKKRKEKSPLLETTSVILGALSLQIGKPSYKIIHVSLLHFN